MDEWNKYQPSENLNQEKKFKVRSEGSKFLEDHWMINLQSDEVSHNKATIMSDLNHFQTITYSCEEDLFFQSTSKEFNCNTQGKYESTNGHLQVGDLSVTKSKVASTTLKAPFRKSFDSGSNVSKNVGILRKCRTPSPYMLKSNKVSIPTTIVGRKSTTHSNGVDKEKLFKPIQFINNGNIPVELHVTNLDQSIDPIGLKNILLAIFGEHVMVLHVSVFVQSDGVFAASVKVPSIQDAQYAISQLHRRKIGHKKITISYGHSGQPHSPQFIRWQIVTLLKEVPGLKLPLFKFLEMFESRYVTTISVSDLYRLKDVCIITDESSGRMVSLHINHRNTPSPSLSLSQDVEPYCMRHYKIRQCPNKGWAEQEVPPLPNIIASLPDFSDNIYLLLASHNNILPLASLCDCYNAECGSLIVDESGVPLEHFVTCINKVSLALANGVKYLKPSRVFNNSNDKNEDAAVPLNPNLANVLNLFGRELVDLLKTQPQCQLCFNRFIPAYHHHFGRQCRVADYGFTKLIDLLEALPNIIQVIGDGNKRTVTLSHRAQIRRFTSDLLRALKTQPCKRMTLSELPIVFERVLGKPFDPVDYGLCRLIDLVNQLSKNTIQVLPTKVMEEYTLAIPKREQTAIEIDRTKQFSKEVVELLGHAPQCSIMFNKFIPAYHHHYGHQCRVADFGFTKLIELFEAIPEIVELEEDGEGDRRVTLTQKEKLRVLSEQVCELVTACYPPGLLLSSLESTFLWQYGYSLKPQVYFASTIDKLVHSLPSVKLVDSDDGKMVLPVEEELIKHLMGTVKRLLISSDDGRMTHSDLKCCFSASLEKYLTPDKLVRLIPDAIQVDVEDEEVVIKLSPLYQLVRQICFVLTKSGGRSTLTSLENAYYREYQQYIQPGELGFPNVQSLLLALPDIVVLRGRGLKRVILLNKDILQRKQMSTNENTQLYLLSKSTDLLQDDISVEDDITMPVIKLPELEAPPSISLSSLISPCKSLLPPSARPHYVQAPHPSSLPSPDKHLLAAQENGSLGAFDSVKCGLKRSGSLLLGSIGSSRENGSDKLQHKWPLPKRRRIRLAAQFETPIDL